MSEWMVTQVGVVSSVVSCVTECTLAASVSKATAVIGLLSEGKRTVEQQRVLVAAAHVGGQEAA